MKGECCRKHFIRYLLDPFLEAKCPDRKYFFECDLAADHYALRPFTSGTWAYGSSTNNTTQSKLSPNIVHRRLLGYNQVRNPLRRLDRLEWTVGFVRNALSHLIARNEGAASIIFALASARAPRCSPCSSVSRALMVRGTRRSGNSNNIFYFLMSRLKWKYNCFSFFAGFQVTTR